MMNILSIRAIVVFLLVSQYDVMGEAPVPTGQSSMQPSNVPSSQPSGQPSTVPSTRPTQQPTQAPSGALSRPPILQIEDPFNFTYYCHPKHPHGAPSPTINIFPSASINGTLATQRAVLTGYPFDPEVDVLTIQGGGGYERNLLPFFNRTAGTLEISHIGGEAVIEGSTFSRSSTNEFWSEVLRFFAYQLIPGNGPPNACVFYQIMKTTKTFTLQVFDVQGRASNLISRKFKLTTAGFIYTGAIPVIVNDANGLKSVSIGKPGAFTVANPNSTISEIFGAPGVVTSIVNAKIS
mmetsp:Transcript_16035/g.15393  ORF Transcript_16035/g.15393 Transcript_16035/m.15393 type:complete len:293 (+) Transcript_16035:382-1260(+)